MPRWKRTAEKTSPRPPKKNAVVASTWRRGRASAAAGVWGRGEWGEGQECAAREILSVSVSHASGEKEDGSGHGGQGHLPPSFLLLGAAAAAEDAAAHVSVVWQRDDLDQLGGEGVLAISYGEKAKCSDGW